LEFLGDAVLQLVLTEALFELFPADREGLLSKRRATLSKGVFLTTLARELGLDACLRLGTSEETSAAAPARGAGGCFEALVGALYLDSDLATVRRIVRALYARCPAASPGPTKPTTRRASFRNSCSPGTATPRCATKSRRSRAPTTPANTSGRLPARASARHRRGPSKKLAEEAAARIALET